MESILQVSLGAVSCSVAGGPNTGEQRHFRENTENVCKAHSWFATVVDGNELGPVYPFQFGD